MKRTTFLLSAALAFPIFGLAADDKTAPPSVGKTAQERDTKTLTPGDQSERPEDLKVTQTIRQAIMKDKVLIPPI